MAMLEPAIHEYNGYTYRPYLDVEPGENKKYFHEVYSPNEKYIGSIRFSSYSLVPYGEFVDFVEGL